MNQHKTQISLSKRIKYACAWMPIPTIRRAMRDVLSQLLKGQTEIKAETQTIHTNHAEIKSEIQAIHANSMKELSSLLNNLSFECVEKVNELKATIFAGSASDRYFIRHNFKEIDSSDPRILNLLNGLDSESALTAALIIRRTEAIKNSPAKQNLNLFTHAEQEKIDNLQKNFYGSILSLSNNVFVYKNKYMPTNRFSPSVFDHLHAIKSLSDESIEHIKKGVILDVGGYIGDSCLMFRDYFPFSPIYSFEFFDENIKLFNQLLELNNLKDVKIVKKALSSTKGRSYFRFLSDTSSYLVDVPCEGDQEVDIDTLDNFVEENSLSNIALIKVDIEGTEQKFLQGAKNTIEKYRPILLLSIYHSWEDFLMIKPIIESWDLDYSFKIRKPVDGSVLRETLLICEPKL